GVRHDDVFAFSDFADRPSNSFCDQTVFLDYMREHGGGNGHLVIPGTRIELRGRECSVAHPFPDQEVERIFTDKRSYLTAYKARKQPLIDSIKASWPRGEVDITAALKEWFEPLLEIGDLTCAGVNARVLLDCSPAR